MILVVIIGVLGMICAYAIFNFPRHSIKRGSIALVQSILNVAFLTLFSQMSAFYLRVGNAGIYLDLTGLFTTLITIWSLFVARNVYDLIDFKRNYVYYEKTRKNL